MPHLYSSPPVQEAICELRLAANSAWDLTVPGRIFDEVRQRFPLPMQQHTKHIEIRPYTGAAEPQVDVSNELRLVAADDKSFVRLGPRLISVHRLAPYQGWEKFKPDIALTWTALRSILDEVLLERVGLRYVNRIAIPLPEIDLADYFDFRLELGEGLPQETNALIVGAAFSFNQDSCRAQLADTVPDSPNESAFLLDFDYWRLGPTLDLDMTEWLEQAHSQIEDLFEGAIRPPLREVFGEIR